MLRQPCLAIYVWCVCVGFFFFIFNKGFEASHYGEMFLCIGYTYDIIVAGNVFLAIFSSCAKGPQCVYPCNYRAVLVDNIVIMI